MVLFLPPASAAHRTAPPDFPVVSVVSRLPGKRKRRGNDDETNNNDNTTTSSCAELDTDAGVRRFAASTCWLLNTLLLEFGRVNGVARRISHNESQTSIVGDSPRRGSPRFFRDRKTLVFSSSSEVEKVAELWKDAEACIWDGRWTDVTVRRRFANDVRTVLFPKFPFVRPSVVCDEYEMRFVVGGRTAEDFRSIPGHCLSKCSNARSATCRDFAGTNVVFAKCVVDGKLVSAWVSALAYATPSSRSAECAAGGQNVNSASDTPRSTEKQTSATLSRAFYALNVVSDASGAYGKQNVLSFLTDLRVMRLLSSRLHDSALGKKKKKTSAIAASLLVSCCLRRLRSSKPQFPYRRKDELVSSALAVDVDVDERTVNSSDVQKKADAPTIDDSSDCSDGTCSVCYEALSACVAGTKRTRCGHTFCWTCLQKWAIACTTTNRDITRTHGHHFGSVAAENDSDDSDVSVSSENVDEDSDERRSWTDAPTRNLLEDIRSALVESAAAARNDGPHWLRSAALTDVATRLRERQRRRMDESHTPLFVPCPMCKRNIFAAAT